MMTTKTFEEAVKATNENYVINQILKPHGSITTVRGTVPWGNSSRKVVWDHQGICTSNKGKRLPQFDIKFE